MNPLVQQITQFLNLSKLTAVTVPGMLVSLALLVFFGTTCQSAATPASVKEFDDLVALLAARLLEFLLLAMVCGLALDPIQRALFQNELFRKTAFPWFNRRRSRFGDRRYGRYEKKERGMALHRTVAPAAAKEDFNPNYAIGRGWLLQSEYDALRDEFYRQSEITTGLILPGCLLAYAALWSQRRCAGGGTPGIGDFVLEYWWLLLLDVGLLYFGLDRLHQFFSETSARIAGRRDKIEESQAEMLVTILGSQTATHRLVQRLDASPAELRVSDLTERLRRYHDQRWAKKDRG